MPELIRPQTRAALHRWREALIGLGITLLGLWLAFSSYGVMTWLGGGIALLGGALVYAGVQMGRFRGTGEGPGVVTLDERRVTYFGPETGGTADLDLLARLELWPDGPHWRLVGENGNWLDIPTDARGAERLLDLFSALPTIRLERVLHHLANPGRDTVILWQAPDQTPRPLLR